MGPNIAFALLIATLSSSFVRAEQLLVHPTYGMSFEGPALALECVATLKRNGESGLVTSFLAKTSNERRICLTQLLQSLTPEPDFTPEDFQRSLRQTSPGSYEVDPSVAIYRKMSNRIGVNVHVAEGIAKLAGNRLIDDSSVLRPLVECQTHPVLDVAVSCNRALAYLTHHSYGSRFFSRSVLTVEERQRAVADWRALDGLLAKGHPIFDAFLESACQTAIRAIGARLLEAIPSSSVAASYLRGMPDTRVSSAWSTETVYSRDVGSHNTANWPGNERVTRIAILMFRPGLSQPASQWTPDREVSLFPAPDYREVFPSLDLELRFAVSTSDQSVRRSLVLAVHEALASLRAVDAKPVTPLDRE